MADTIPQPPADSIPPVTDPEIRHAIELYDLQRAVRGVLHSASPAISLAERTAVLTEALSYAVLFSETWCSACQADPERLCKVHTAGSELADASRRHAYRQLPGRPRIDVDL